MRRAGEATARARQGPRRGRRSSPAPRRPRPGRRSRPGPPGPHGPAPTPRRGPRPPWPARRGRATTGPAGTEAVGRSTVRGWPPDVLAPRRGAPGRVRARPAATRRWTRPSGCRDDGRSARSPQPWPERSPDRGMRRPTTRARDGGTCRIRSPPYQVLARLPAPWTASPAPDRDRLAGRRPLRGRRARPPPTRDVRPGGRAPSHAERDDVSGRAARTTPATAQGPRGRRADGRRPRRFRRPRSPGRAGGTRRRSCGVRSSVHPASGRT